MVDTRIQAELTKKDQALSSNRVFQSPNWFGDVGEVDHVDPFFEAHPCQGFQKGAGKKVHDQVRMNLIDESSRIFGVARHPLSPGMVFEDPADIFPIHIHQGNFIVFLLQKILNAWPGYPAGSEYENLAHN